MRLSKRCHISRRWLDLVERCVQLFAVAFRALRLRGLSCRGFAQRERCKQAVALTSGRELPYRPSAGFAYPGVRKLTRVSAPHAAGSRRSLRPEIDEGADKLSGGLDADLTMIGGEGNDKLTGGAGADVLYGGCPKFHLAIGKGASD